MMHATKTPSCVFEYSQLQETRLIGEGTCSRVYAGEWKGLTVAVKLLREGVDATAQQDFENERVVNARLRHPNIVHYIGLAAIDGAHGLVFEYAAGGSLDVRKFGYAKGAKTLDVALDIARALDYAHCNGIVHRDVKPSQVLMNCCGRALLGDWGLATEIGSADCSTGETGTWEFVSISKCSRSEPLLPRLS